MTLAAKKNILIWPSFTFFYNFSVYLTKDIDLENERQNVQIINVFVRILKELLSW